LVKMAGKSAKRVNNNALKRTFENTDSARRTVSIVLHIGIHMIPSSIAQGL
jgi:hypothetical protein